MTKLTALQVAHAKNRGLINDGAGLYLKITDSGTKSWVFRYRQNGRQRYHGLGSVKILSLAEARDAALKCRKMRLAGLDPIEEKKKQKIATQLEEAKAISFQDCAEQYISAHKAAWRNGNRLW